MSFVTRLRSCMNQGETIRAFACRLGLPDQTIRAWLNKGTSPQIHRFPALAQKLGVSPSWLAWGDEPDA